MDAVNDPNKMEKVGEGNIDTGSSIGNHGNTGDKHGNVEVVIKQDPVSALDVGNEEKSTYPSEKVNKEVVIENTKFSTIVRTISKTVSGLRRHTSVDGSHVHSRRSGSPVPHISIHSEPSNLTYSGDHSPTSHHHHHHHYYHRHHHHQHPRRDEGPLSPGRQPLGYKRRNSTTVLSGYTNEEFSETPKDRQRKYLNKFRPLTRVFSNESDKTEMVKNGILGSLDQTAEGVSMAMNKAVTMGRYEIMSMERRASELTSMKTFRSSYNKSRLQKRTTSANTKYWEWLSVRLGLESMHKSVGDFIRGTYFRFFILVLNLVVDFIFCLLYLVELQITSPKYELDPYWLFISRPAGFYDVLLAFSFFNAFMSIFSTIFAEVHGSKIVGVVNTLNLLTTIPFVVSLFIKHGQYLYVPYFLRCWIVVERLRNVLRTKSEMKDSDIVKRVGERTIVLSGIIIAIILTALCCFQYFELMFPPAGSPGRQYGIVDSLYFIIITASTVGYGDITPVSLPGRIIIICLIVIALSVLPGLISSIVENAKLHGSGRGSYKKGRDPYVVVAGVFDNPTRVAGILNAILHREATWENFKVVLLARTKMNSSVKTLLSGPIYQNNVTVLQGLGMDEKDLRRIDLRHASAAFLLADKGANSARIEDEMNTLRAWLFGDFSPETPIYMYTMLPQTESYVQNVASAAVCTEDLKQLLLGFTCLYKGSATLILNLLHQANSFNKYDEPWKAQYGDGLSNEIYSAPVNPIFVGKEFGKLSWFLYREFQVILFAVDSYVRNTGKYHLALNPGNKYLLDANDVCIFIAQDKCQVGQISRMTFDQYKWAVREYDVRATPTPSEALGRRLSSENHESFFIDIDAETKVGQPDAENDDLEVPLCQLLKTPVDDMSKCILKDASTMTKHLLVCTEHFEVFKFVCALRSAQITSAEFRSILFLSARLPTEEEFQQLSIFPKIFFMQGDCRVKKDLVRAGIVGADKVVLMSLKKQSGENEAADLEDMEDSRVIVVSTIINDMFSEAEKPKFVVVELAKRNNIKFVRPTKGGTYNNKTVRQQIHNVGGTPLEVAEAAAFEYLYAPSFASGQVLVATMLDSILFQTFLNPAILDVVKLLCGIRYQKSVEMLKQLRLDPSYLCYIDVPEEYEGRTFSELYEELATTFSIIPLGIYRAPCPEWGNAMPFIYTNPLGSILMKKTDLVYVLKHGLD